MVSLFVGNLSFVLTDAELEYWFEATGNPVESVVIANDRTADRFTGSALVVIRRNDPLSDGIEGAD